VKLTNTDPTIVSSCFSRGHRLARAEIKITSGLLYSDQLRAEGVIVDREERAKLIGDSINIAAAKLEATPDLPKELFEELIDLVEAPLMITGAVPKHYLDLPAEVLCTVMRVHQRYVPLYARNTVVDPLSLSAREYLLPKFLCITNSLPEAVEQVQRGNERVLEARLADAQFFLTADQAITSEERRSQLSRVSFAAGLGNLLDRTERLEWCVIELIKMNGEISKIEAEQIIRAAHYCKHDLVSQMVSEFPELQGIMGAKYLLAEGESRATALAVLEHYLPRGAGDVLPQSKEGNILAIAERLELLLSIYAKGDRPSGSSDPYALRRAGNALLLLLWDMNWSLNLWELLQNACEHWFHLLPDLTINSNGLAIELAEFLQQRFLSLLQEQGCDPDIAQAVAGLTNESKRILNDVTDGQMRV
jgi:glycyl-tRNA synthetase beta chain